MPYTAERCWVVIGCKKYVALTIQAEILGFHWLFRFDQALYSMLMDLQRLREVRARDFPFVAFVYSSSLLRTNKLTSSDLMMMMMIHRLLRQCSELTEMHELEGHRRIRAR